MAIVKNTIFAPITKNTITDVSKENTIRIDDNDHPLSFKEWLHRTSAIKKGFEIEEYNNYIAEWNRIKDRKSDLAKKIKEDYISFIRSISLFFSDDEKKKFNEDFDLDNYLNLEEIIPHCASKLRDIMVYYQNKRESIKRTKLKYNLVGTSLGVERLLHDYLLRAFTKHGSYIKINDSDLYDKLPALLDVNTSLEIKIDELYDDTEYFDKNPEKTGFYYNPKIMSDQSAVNFYSEHGYSTSADVDWLLSDGFAEIVKSNQIAEIARDAETELEDISIEVSNALGISMSAGSDPLSAYVDYDKVDTIEYYQKELTKRYLGEDQYVLSGGYFRNKTVDLEYEISPGNNWITFPSGEFSHEKPGFKIAPIPLSATTITDNEYAIGAGTYYDADKMFKSYGNVVEGAWLKDVSKDYSEGTMVCNIYSNRPFQFRFPFPDYGASGEGIDWSGPGMDNSDQTFYTLPNADRTAILSAYWESELDKSCLPINLNRSTLPECGARASTNYASADRMSVRPDGIHDESPNGVFNGAQKEAYLYKITSSDIPITPGQNYLYWPYLNTTIDGTFDLVKNGCGPVCLTAEEWRTIFGSRAGYGLFDSDIIYKLDSPSGNPIECAFLKGVPFASVEENLTSWTDNATGCCQVGRYNKCQPNAFATFIWLDEDTPMDDVVFHVEHRLDCPYRNEKKYSLYENHPGMISDEDIDFKEWKKCDCGAILYSPFGHPGSAFDDFDGYADCCFVDNTYPLPFEKSIWFGDDLNVDGQNKGYLDSEDFGWYQLTGRDQLEPDAGWGKGHWVAGGNGKNPSKFMLKRGKQYKYFRSGAGHTDYDVINGTMPPLIITHRNSGKVLATTKPTWMKCILGADGEWQETDMPSEMVINSDDNLMYDHIKSEWWCITGNKDVRTWTETFDVTLDRDDDYKEFVDYNVVPVSSYIVEAIWPSMQSTVEPDLPVRGQLEIVRWKARIPGVGTVMDRTLPASQPFYFAATRAGTATISASGYSNVSASDTTPGQYVVEDNTYSYVPGASSVFTVKFMNPITQTVTSATNDVYTVNADTIGFPLNIPVSGWNYGTEGNPDQGARPIWGEGSNESDSITHSKAITKWGGGVRLVDDYVPIMQPKISDIVLETGMPISYIGTSPFCWNQPLEINEPVRDRRWCKLYIKPDMAAVLSGELADKTFKEMVSSATDETSDMVLESEVDGDDVTLNYWAHDSFVWNEHVIDITNGVAPTGGEYVPAFYERTIESESPWANLSNRHDPTIATVVNMAGLYAKRDSGGYSVPQYLGASVALARDVLTTIDYVKRNESFDGELITDPKVYSEDTGFTGVQNNRTIKLANSDSGWMKAPVMNGINAGFVNGADRNQQFMSYQSTVEKRNHFNDIGLMRPNDIFDPWKGPEDSVWRSELYESHLTKQIPVAAVRKTYFRTDKIYEWAQDMYGYSYGLFKENPASGYDSAINKKKYALGVPYVRTETGTVERLGNYLEAFDDNDTYYRMEIHYNVMCLTNSNCAMFYRLVYDDSSTRAFKIKDDLSNCLKIQMPEDSVVAGTWFYPESNTLDVIVLGWSGSPKKYQYSIYSFHINSFKYDKKLVSGTFTAASLMPSNDPAKSRIDSYVRIGPVVDHLDGKYSCVFQLKNLSKDSTSDRIGRFIRTTIDRKTMTAKSEMVKKSGT